MLLRNDDISVCMTNAERQKKWRERNAALRKIGQTVTKSVTDDPLAVTGGVTVREEDMMKCPDGVDGKEWRYACERAERARRYALVMPDFVKPDEKKFQDPLWQWENEVRGRFGGVIGGSLSGSRNQQV